MSTSHQNTSMNLELIFRVSLSSLMFIFFIYPNLAFGGWWPLSSCLDDIEKASGNLQMCRVNQKFQGECSNDRRELKIARLECKKEGINLERIYSAQELGEQKVAGNPSESPYATKVRLQEREKARKIAKQEKEKARKIAKQKVLSKHKNSFSRLLDWPRGGGSYKIDYNPKVHLQNFDTRGCPGSFEGGNDNYILDKAMYAVIRPNGVPLDSAGALNVPPAGKRFGIHLFFHSMKASYCYSPNGRTPINIPKTQLSMLHEKNVKIESIPYPEPTVGRIFIHIENSQPKATALYNQYEKALRKWDLIGKDLERFKYISKPPGYQQRPDERGMKRKSRLRETYLILFPILFPGDIQSLGVDKQ